MVYCEWFTDGADCDGRLSTQGLITCHTSRLAAKHVAECPKCHNITTHTGIGAEGSKPKAFCWCGAPLDWQTAENFPDWTPEESSQRDYQAEAAGY
jgi:hypothetical protein